MGAGGPAPSTEGLGHCSCDSYSSFRWQRANAGASQSNEYVASGALMRRTVGSRKGYGMLYVDEVGFERRGHIPDALRVAHGLNLHAHGLYFGPRLDWERTRDLWMEITKKRFGVESRGFFISAVKRFAENPGRAIRWALNHMLKYVSKPPAVTPERLASLIAAFDGAKRVHSLGLFSTAKKRSAKERLSPVRSVAPWGLPASFALKERI